MKKRVVYIPKTGSEYQRVAKMFEATGEWQVIHCDGLIFNRLWDHKEFDLVCFTGGSDVSPWMYGEENTHSFCDENRDRIEAEIYEDFVGKVPMVGICRGGQFLNVMNGGKMIQHIDGHSMSTHPTHMMKWCDVHPGEYVDTMGDHHQAMILGEDGTEFATGGGGDWNNPTPDVIWYEHTKCLCFQPHPEWGHEPTRKLFFDLIGEYIG